MAPFRVLIADDEQTLREALVDLIESDPELTVVAVAKDAAEAVELASKVRLDVALLDVKMPGGGGAYAAIELRTLHPGLPIVAHSAYQDRATVLDMLRAGAISFVVKGTPAETILRTIHLALRGEGTLSGEVTADVIHELAQLLQRSEAMTRQLAALHRERSELLQVISHELFTPITTIQGFAQTIATYGSSLPPEDARVLADGMTRATERLRRLVGNVRTAAALDRHDLRITTVPTPVSDLLESARSEFASASQRLAIPNDDVVRRLRVWAQPDLATRALATVVENALDFGPDGTPVELEVVGSNGSVELSVSDRGPGIPEEIHERIFDPLTQMDATASRAHEGLGVGLFLARRVMLAHGGDVRAEERAGGGTRIVLSFLLAEEPSASRP
jgi:signal transduction histidine kinase